MQWREDNGVKWIEAELDGAKAAFSTRPGGISPPPYESLNLGFMTGDQKVRVKANRERLLEVLGRDVDGVLSAHQVHEDRIMVHAGAQTDTPFANATPIPERADGHATADSALTPFVMTADCLPIALSGPEGVAMVHGGWRGLAAGIAGQAADMVRATSAAVGPGIGPCCYEVGAEVQRAFADIDGVFQGRMLDLPGVAQALLERAGVRTVESIDLCTSCNPELLFSHRRDGPTTGRQGGLAWLT